MVRYVKLLFIAGLYVATDELEHAPVIFFLN